MLVVAADVVELATGGMLLELQSKATLCTPILQSGSGACSGKWKLTAVAPPHCVLSCVDLSSEHETVCLQVSPLG